ncbi:hypothetical protein VTK56DRAFT_4721 [Thermocarpiscus australiensis]
MTVVQRSYLCSTGLKLVRMVSWTGENHQRPRRPGKFDAGDDNRWRRVHRSKVDKLGTPSLPLSSLPSIRNLEWNIQLRRALSDVGGGQTLRLRLGRESRGGSAWFRKVKNLKQETELQSRKSRRQQHIRQKFLSQRALAGSAATTSLSRFQRTQRSRMA